MPAVFENLRNFIRHGKQAHDNNAIEEPILETIKDSSLVHTQAASSSSSSNVHSTNINNKGVYENAIKQIIAEENEERSKLPLYAGLERYKLLEKLGDGAFSVVYKALNLDCGMQVAVKVVNKQELSLSQRSGILKEVTIMRQLRHKNIVELLDFSETEQHYFIVLELVSGGELFHQIVKLTYFSENLSRHVILQVASAIRYLHEEAGVVHRDIKPENLLFYPVDIIPSEMKQLRKGEDETKMDEGEFLPGVGSGGIGQIKLADFGLSKIIWDSKTMTPCGTVGYTAPEIVKDERYSKSVDMWALGCVLYTILCGFPPFYDESIEILTEKVAKGQYTFLSPWWDEISKSAKDLISHLLTVDPDRRYTIDQFLSHPWITQKVEPTAPALDAPKTVGGEILPDDLEKEFLSPAAATLKEVFDVSNAVHRMEEENKRRQVVNFGDVPVEEEGEGEEEVGNDRMSIDGVQRQLEKVSVRQSSVPRTTVPQSQQQQQQFHRYHNNNPAGLFDLHLEGATLLERRKKAQAQTQVIPSIYT